MIFDPLGMSDTGFSVPQCKHHRIADAFADEQAMLNDVRLPPVFESGGGVTHAPLQGTVDIWHSVLFHAGARRETSPLIYVLLY